MITRISLAICILALVGFSSHQLKTAVLQQSITQQISDIQKNTRGRSQEQNNKTFLNLLNDVNALLDKSTLTGGFLDIAARSKSLVYAYDETTSIITENDLKEAYESALVSKPYNGYLWSKYALHSSQLEGLNEKTLNAIDRAIEFGLNDYQTLRVLALIAIRDWPKFGCDKKTTMLEVVELGLKKNDRILALWNIGYGHLPIGKYITSLMEIYDFNQEWAEIQVRVCGSNT